MEHDMPEFRNTSTNLTPEIWILYRHPQNWVFSLYVSWRCNLINDGNSENNLPFNSVRNGNTGIRSANNISNDLNLIRKLISIVIVIVCLSGLLGNGRVIWLLSFNIRRNPFTTYVMNLSIADFGVLTCLLCICTLAIALNWYNRSPGFCQCFNIIFVLLFLTYSSSQFLLTIISIDRCVAVLFPIWYRCHRPRYLSPVVCAIIWIVFSLLSGIHFSSHYAIYLVTYQLIANALLCTPIMVISTLTLLITICCKPKQRLRGKLVRAILLALLFFLIFCLPLNLFYIITFEISDVGTNSLLGWIGFACASVNSSINPLIYFLVGRRQKKGRAKVSMKVALERVFKDEQDAVEEETPMEENNV